ncbi:MAG TPA: hypothetical protein VM869_03660, partial [Enhygromyxa sp.]|nr:hypothetical protein [Enhygromyxa sp.]
MSTSVNVPACLLAMIRISGASSRPPKSLSTSAWKRALSSAGHSQREYVLRQQLKAIKGELGEMDEESGDAEEFE